MGKPQSIEAKEIHDREVALITMAAEGKTVEINHLLKEEKKEKSEIKININYAPPSGTALYQATKNYHRNTVATLLDHGAITHLTDEKFETPLQYLIQSTDSKREPILSLLLERQTYVNENDINQLLAFGQEFYAMSEKKDPNQDQAIVNYIASRLSGTNVDILLRKKGNSPKYLAHLKSFLGQKEEISEKGESNKIDLEGWCKDIFLPLRIRSFVKIILDILRYESPDLQKDLKTTVHMLCQELIVACTLLQLSYSVRAIATLPVASRAEAQKKLARNFVRHLDEELPENHERSFPGGWYRHAVYLAFVKSPTRRLAVRVDNLGSGLYTTYQMTDAGIQLGEATYNEAEKKYHTTPFYLFPRYSSVSTPWQLLHPQSPDNAWLHQSCMLGHYDLNTEKEKIEKYTEGLIEEAVRGITTSKLDDEKKEEKQCQIIKKDAIRKLYDFSHFIPGQLTNDLPGAPALLFRLAQTVGNCVVENSQTGLERRLQRAGWEAQERRWLLNEEIKIASIEFNHTIIPLDFCWEKYNKARQLSGDLTHALKELYRKKTENVFVPMRDEPQHIDDIYINLAVIKETELKTKEEELKEKKESVTDRKVASQFYQDIYNPKNTVLPEKIFEHCQLQQVLVLGVAGVGKSIFAQQIANRWAHEKSWKKFPDLIWIPLRHLTEARYPRRAKPYTALDIIEKELFPAALPEQSYTKMRRHFEIHKRKALWLLDGYDETVGRMPDYLITAFHELLNMPNHILTSRPEAAKNLLYNTRQRLMLIGFTDKNISNYIHHSSEIKNKSAEDLLTFLKSTPEIWEIAHIPINLALICGLWKRNPLTEKNMTMTKLYFDIVTELLKQYLHQQNILLDRRLLQEESKEKNVVDWKEIKSEKIQETLMTHCGSEFKALEHLAFEGMYHHSLLLDEPCVTRALQLITPDEEKQKTVKNKMLKIGLVKTSSQEYYFLHLTFQEFLAASHVIRWLRNAENTAEFITAITFIRTQKYQPRYALLFRFMAGLVSLDKSDIGKKEADLFYAALISFPHSLSDSFYTAAIRDCLQELGISKIEKLKKHRIPSYWRSPSQEARKDQSILRETIECATYLDSYDRDDPYAAARIIIFLSNGGGIHYESILASHWDTSVLYVLLDHELDLLCHFYKESFFYTPLAHLIQAWIVTEKPGWLPIIANNASLKLIPLVATEENIIVYDDTVTYIPWPRSVKKRQLLQCDLVNVTNNTIMNSAFLYLQALYQSAAITSIPVLEIIFSYFMQAIPHLDNMILFLNHSNRISKLTEVIPTLPPHLSRFVPDAKFFPVCGTKLIRTDQSKTIVQEYKPDDACLVRLIRRMESVSQYLGDEETWAMYHGMVCEIEKKNGMNSSKIFKLGLFICKQFGERGEKLISEKFPPRIAEIILGVYARNEFDFSHKAFPGRLSVSTSGYLIGRNADHTDTTSHFTLCPIDGGEYFTIHAQKWPNTPLHISHNGKKLRRNYYFFLDLGPAEYLSLTPKNHGEYYILSSKKYPDMACYIRNPWDVTASCRLDEVNAQGHFVIERRPVAENEKKSEVKTVVTPRITLFDGIFRQVAENKENEKQSSGLTPR